MSYYLHYYFEESGLKYRSETAVHYADGHVEEDLSYSEVYQQANEIATKLTHYGGAPRGAVACLCRESVLIPSLILGYEIHITRTFTCAISHLILSSLLKDSESIICVHFSGCQASRKVSSELAGHYIHRFPDWGENFVRAGEIFYRYVIVSAQTPISFSECLIRRLGRHRQILERRFYTRKVLQM